MLKSASSEGAGGTLCGHPRWPPLAAGSLPPQSRGGWGREEPGQVTESCGGLASLSFPAAPPRQHPPPPCGFPLTSFNFICLEGSSVCPHYLLLPLAWSPTPTPGPRTCTEGCEINALKPNTRLVPDDL